MAKKIVLTYYFLNLINATLFCFFFATYVLFLDQAGLSKLQINSINASFMLSVFLLELPTGSIADNFGRKLSTVLSFFVFSLAFFIYFISDSYICFLTAEIIAALAYTLASGAFDAWMYDTVKGHDPKYNTDKVFSNSKKLDYLGKLIGVTCGAYLGSIDLSYPWLASSLGMIVVGFVAIFLIKEETFEIADNLEEKIVKQREKPAIYLTIKTSIEHGIRNKSIFFVVLFAMFYMFVCQGANMFWQLKYTDVGLSKIDLGWFFAGAIVLMFIGASLTEWLNKYFGLEKKALLANFIVVIIGIFLAGAFQSLSLSIIFFYLHELARGSFEPQIKIYLNKRIKQNEFRATILSFQGMMTKFGCMIGLLVSGLLADLKNISFSWMATSLIALLVLPFLIYFKNGE